MKGIILGFLFGSVFLASVSIIIGIIAPKPPESINIKAPNGSEFTNSITYNSSNSEPSHKFSFSSSGITLPTTNRNLNRNSSIESAPKTIPKRPNPNFNLSLKINQKMQDGPLQPKISNKNTDSSVQILN